jgi:hypothetical protein
MMLLLWVPEELDSELLSVYLKLDSKLLAFLSFSLPDHILSLPKVESMLL